MLSRRLASTTSQTIVGVGLSSSQSGGEVAMGRSEAAVGSHSHIDFRVKSHLENIFPKMDRFSA
jgi:hypothetical protein